MKLDFLFKKNLWFPGWGEVSLSAFLIAVVSGFLLIPFIPAGTDTFISLSKLIASGFFGYLIHSVHSYSGDFFLIATLVHILEYLYKKTHLSYRISSWLWLVFLAIISVLVVFTGFLSLGSKESTSAIGIFTNLLLIIPLFGKSLVQFLFGSEVLNVIYLHHASTFTIVALILIYIHLKRLKSSQYAFVYTLILLIVISIIFPAKIGLHPESVSPVVKGPWYFVGLQELLAWLPAWFAGIFLPLLSVILFAVLPANEKYSNLFITIIIGFIILYFIEAIIATFFRGDAWQLLLR